MASVQQARTNFLHCTRPCKVPVSNNIWLLSLLCDELLSMGTGGCGGRNELQWIVFWPQLRSGASTWPGSTECQQPVDLDLAVLGCVCCCKCCAGPCERVTITVHALRTGDSAWRARRLISCSDKRKEIQAGLRAAAMPCRLCAKLRTLPHKATFF